MATTVVPLETGEDISATGSPLTAEASGTEMVYVASNYGLLSPGTTVNIKLV